MSEKETDLSTRARRFRTLPENSEDEITKAAKSEPSELFRDSDNGKIITKLEK